MGKAYHCRSYQSETSGSVIIYADNRGQARADAANELCIEFTDVWAVRAPWADDLPRQQRYYGKDIGWQDYNEPDITNPVVMEAMRAQGWWGSDEPAAECKKCELQVWEDLPLSALVDGVCGYCRRDSVPTSEQ